MRIWFYSPPVHHYAGLRYKMLPLISLPTLTAWFNQRGHDALAFDLEAQEVAPPLFRRDFDAQRQYWPDMIGITGLSISKWGMREIMQIIREVGYKGLLVVGGVYMTLHPEDGLAWGADLVVTGECEGNIVELVENGARGIHKGESAPIESIPAPDWNHFSPYITSYESNIRLLLPAPGICMMTRGCPWHCIFCANVIFGGRPTRFKPPDNILRDMNELKTLGVQNVYVYDDELVGAKMPDGWMSEVADRIGPLRMPWLTQGRCSKKYVTPELMNTVRRAGGHTVFWGVESFSPKVLNFMRKGTRPADIWHTLRVARAEGINNAVFTMIGNYGETEEDLAITAQALHDAYKEGLIQLRQSTICTPLEGTELARLGEAEGWHKPVVEFTAQELQHAAVSTPWLSADRMVYWLNKFNEACPVGLNEVPAKTF